MFLDLILARVGLINLSNEIDPGMAESISSVIWVQPRIVTECPELKEMSYILLFSKILTKHTDIINS